MVRVLLSVFVQLLRSKFEIKILVSSCRVKVEFEVSTDTSSLQYLFDGNFELARIRLKKKEFVTFEHVRIEGIH